MANGPLTMENRNRLDRAFSYTGITFYYVSFVFSALLVGYSFIFALNHEFDTGIMSLFAGSILFSGITRSPYSPHYHHLIGSVFTGMMFFSFFLDPLPNLAFIGAFILIVGGVLSLWTA